MPELVLQHVTKLFGDAVAVDDLSLSIGDGEFVCLLGPSGCGKTTTLRMIAGFEAVDRGAILVNGEDITVVPPQRRDIGLVFQHYALFPHMTVAQNVGYGLKMRRYSSARIANEVGATLDLVRLGELATRYPSQISGGQQQRVALARALAVRPRLLLMDEPLSNLDAKLRDDMRAEIRRIQKQVGITTIFVTHDQAEAFALADRIGVIMQGRLQQIADPVSLYEKPASAILKEGVDGFLVQRTPVSLVKQERVLLSRKQPDAAENVYSCRIEARIYLGGNISYVCRLPGAVVNALLPSHPSVERFEPGDTVFAWWSDSDCQVFAV